MICSYKQAWAIFKAVELNIEIPVKYRTLERRVRDKLNTEQNYG